ncbi:hypothetical protein ACIA8G_24405 [Lentzea sp. NPDC051213]|uniref:hypothetical protein n=1 Tax=Lentzea sp. NPDC051213 TaxID=3364126 RepID=UPI00378F4B3D
MTGVRRRGYFTAAVAIMGVALLTALLASPPDRPVDIRLVAPPPPAAETVTATATTTVSAVGPVVPAPPPPPPPPAAKPLPRQKPPATPAAPSSSQPRGLLDLLRCDYEYLDDFERCLEWPFNDDLLCDLLKEHHLKPVDVRGPDGFDLHCD